MSMSVLASVTPETKMHQSIDCACRQSSGKELEFGGSIMGTLKTSHLTLQQCLNPGHGFSLETVRR